MSAGIPAKVAVNIHIAKPRSATYVIDGNEFAFVLKHHNLVLRISAGIGIFPVINRYLSGFRAIIAWYVEDATTWDELFAASSLLTDARRVVDVRVR
jgi:hypothetical protein